ncbi:MAG: aldehyde dehydrogenase family protein [Gammaproteobacteria bacterium]|nr:aldehyde dehydrogenase family protein [Gammaproteobacteria bacterium]
MKLLDTLNLKTNNFGTYSSSGWNTTTDAGQIASINPATGELIANVYTCTEQDYQSLVNNSLDVQKEWRILPAPKRGEVIRQIGNALRDHKTALGNLISTEAGKIKQEGDGEVQEMIDIADFAVGQSRMLYGRTMHSERACHRMYEQWHPLGVVGIISAFNFPVAVWSWNAFIAAIAGNTVIWKPSSKVPLCAIAVQHICNQVTDALGFPGIFSLFLPGKKSITEQFVNNHSIALLSFTGSSTVGRYIAKNVAQRMGKSLLECSGNNAVIVEQSANLALAIPAIVFGAVGTAGQRCTTTRRVFIHESIYTKLVAQLVAAYQQVKIGDPRQEHVLMGPLIDQTAVDAYLKTIEIAKTAGATIRYGGHCLSQPGYFVEPTLIEMDRPLDIMQQETFAPILYLQAFKTLDEAIHLQNNVPQGLSSALFTNDLKNAEHFLSVIGSDCGIANINMGTSGAEIGGAFGGEKETGGGRESGSDSWKAYMRRQTNTINWGSTLPLAQGIKFDL